MRLGEKHWRQGGSGGRPPKFRASGFWRRARMGVVCLLPLLAAACSAMDAPAPSSAGAAPAAAPRTTGGTPAGTERKHLIALFGGEYSAPTTERYLNEILTRLAPATQTPSETYRVTILNSPIVNAFALPSGDIFVTRGLLALANDSSEIAAVMAHEIAHVTAQHAAKRAEKEKTAALFARVSTAVLDRPDEGQEQEARGRLGLAQFSRQQEFEADQIGIKTIGQAGYDPFAASRFLSSLGRWTAMRASLLGENANAGKPDMMSTHPSTPERIAQAVVEARQIGAPGVGDSGRDAYLSAISGLSFGDDPSEGLVRGPRFVHPKLGFSFAAPEGFVLENQSVALIGVGEGGAQALRLDSVNVDPSTALETTIASGWIDGLKTASVETLKIDDLQAATAVAQGDQWSFRLGAVRMGPKVYRLIFAARSLTPAVDARFRASINSFHRLSAQEAASAHPLRVEIVEAGASDTPETMGKRMAIADRPVEQFLLLNGLEKDAALRPGARYKIVVE
ncbi:M48 family metalloprotease [Methylocapsa sp. S129]|uniref:M48 family metalloprotease n=1 Tax=Methylocapsa sp. S129 TaxID=1641869 RepID=UPI001FF04481|nr:M48 family metalloprotease [Methylocapsa sp. S129]